MKSICLLTLLAACSFPHPADVTFGESAITIVSGDAQVATVNQPLLEELVVNVVDADLRPIPNFTVEFNVTVGNGTLAKPSERTDAQGNARMQFTVGKRAGANEVDVTGEGITTDRVFFAATGLIGPPVRLTPATGDGASATVATVIDVAAKLEDEYGNGVPGMMVDHAFAGAGNGNVSPHTSTTDADGLAHTTLTVSTIVGANPVDSSMPGVTPTTVTVTGTAAAAASLHVVSGNNTFAWALLPSTPLVVESRDAFGNLTGGAPIEFVRTSGAGTIVTPTTTTDSSGYAQSTIIPASMIDDNVIEARSPGIAPVVFTVQTRRFEASQGKTGLGGTTIESTFADLNRDGLDDLLAAQDPSIAIHMNTSAPGAGPTFATPVSISVGDPGDAINFLSTADVDGDTAPDVFYTNGSQLRYLRNTTAIGASTPTFATAINIGSEPQTSGIAVADLDGDQKSEVVTVRGNSQVFVYRNTGTAFSSSVSVSTGGLVFPSRVFLVDIDGDGKRDIVLGGRNNGISVARNTTVAAGSLSFANVLLTLPSGCCEGVSVGDVDGDGDVDIVGSDAQTDPTNYVFANTSVAGTVSFAASVAITSGVRMVNVKDLNGDGRADLVGLHMNPGSSQAAAAVRLHAATTGATFQTRETFAYNASIGLVYDSILFEAHLDNDPYLDLAVCVGGSTGMRWVTAE